MEKHRHVFEEFATFENVYDGYLLARKNKRNKDEVLAYSAFLEENIINDVNRLRWHMYEPGTPREFFEYYPKVRLIHAMPFNDRVLNCAWYNVMWPIYFKSFYEHSYGSIPNRGVEKAVSQVQYWMRLVGENWFMGKLDIAKFFFRLPIDIQMRELMKPVDDPEMEWFLQKAILCDGRPFGLPLDCTDVTTAERVCGVGMQVGSLISQTTANVALTPLDHFIKRVIHVPYYVRYMDDMLIFCPTKEECWSAVADIDSYLQENLGLQLNRKTAVIPVGKGVEFIGRMIWPGRVALRKSTSLAMKRHLRYVMDHYSTGELPFEYCDSVIKSYLGLMQHCDCDDLRNKVLEDFVLIRKHYEIEDDEFEEGLLS